jgi:hypothetical protein
MPVTPETSKEASEDATPRGPIVKSCPVFGDTGEPPTDPCRTRMSRPGSMPKSVVDGAPAVLFT